MPIIGLTDNVTPRFPTLGKLRKGAPSEERQNAQGKKFQSYGKDLEYFRFTSENPEVQKKFVELYGEKPAALHVYLPYATVNENFATWKELWKSGGLQHRCDGQTMTIWLAPDGKYHSEPKPCPYFGKIQSEEEKRKDPPCKEVGRLSLILPLLWRAGFIGFVTLETHSKHDLISIASSLQAVMEAPGNASGLSGVEFVLRRAPETISTPGDGGQRVRRQKWLVKIEPAVRWAQLQLEAAQRAANTLAIEAPKGQVIDGKTGEILQDLQAPEDDDFDDEEPQADDWKSDPAAQIAFKAKMEELGLGKSDVLAALGIAKVTEFAGTWDELIAKLEDYSMGKKLKEAEAKQEAAP
jgi:hypothetical protein